MTIFLTVVIVETAFAAFCILTKSNHEKERSIIRVAYFMGFALLAVLPIIDWGLRYYALASFLLLLAAFGAKAIIQDKGKKREYKAASVVLRALGMTALIFAFALPAILFPQNKIEVAATGEHQVLNQTFTYTDEKRVESYSGTGEKRKLNVQFWYPDKLDRKYPLIVFSHGGLGVKSSNESLYNELASHGYVVCSIDHTYQSFYTTDNKGDVTWIDLGYVRELFAEDPQTDIVQSYEYYEKWMKLRTDDINFVIDYIIMEAENNTADIIYQLVDIKEVGVMGHSLGGSAALGVGRMRDDVSAIIALESPFLYDIEGVKNDQFVFADQVYPVPVLNVYSDSAWSILGERPQYAANYKMLSDTDATALNVHIRGVGHLALTDFALTSPLLTRVFDRKNATTEETVYGLKTINKVCLDFFNRYLKGNT